MDRPQFIVDIEATNRCNAKCSFCPRDATPHQGLMSPDVFTQALARVVEFRGVLRQAIHPEAEVMLNIAGLGEPLINRHVPEWVRQVREAGLACGLATNASLLNESRGQALLDAGLTAIMINAGDTGKDYEDVYRLPFQTTHDNVVRFARMAEGRCLVQVVLVDHWKERGYLAKMRHFWCDAKVRRFWRKRGITSFFVFPVMNRSGALFVDDMQYEVYAELAEARRLLAESGGQALCLAPFLFLFVGYDGQYYLCCADWKKQTPLGSVFDASFVSVLRQKLEYVTTRDPICRTCNHDPINRLAEVLRGIKAGTCDQSERDALIAELTGTGQLARAHVEMLAPAATRQAVVEDASEPASGISRAETTFTKPLDHTGGARMLDPGDLIAAHIVEEASRLYSGAAPYNLKGANFLGDAIAIYGAARLLTPRIMCEIGAASGFSSVMLLEGCLRGGGDPTLYAYDLMDNLYYDSTKRVGFYLQETAPHLTKYYQLHTGPGCYATAFMDHCKGSIGLAYIDASHTNPWAALDVLALLPVMVTGGWLLLGAVGIDAGYMQGPSYLYHYWKGPKFIAPQYSEPESPTITGFLQYDGDADQAVDCALRAVGADWQSDVSDDYIDKVARIVAAFVGEGHARRLLDLARGRSAQYRLYAEMHEQFLRKQLRLIEDLSEKTASLSSQNASLVYQNVGLTSQNASLRTRNERLALENASLSYQLACITSSYSWRWTKGARYVVGVIRPLLKRA